MSMKYVKTGYVSAEELVAEFKLTNRPVAAAQAQEVIQTLKTKSRFAGYIVLGDLKPMSVVTKSTYPIPDGGVLMFGSYATVFPTMEDAEEAIKRTEAYCAEYHYAWFNKKSIFPVAPVGVVFE